MEKKIIVIGKTELDITKNILDLLNKKVKKIEFKKSIIKIIKNKFDFFLKYDFKLKLLGGFFINI